MAEKKKKDEEKMDQSGKWAQDCFKAKGRYPLRRIERKNFYGGAPLWFHIDVQGFDTEWDVDDIYEGIALTKPRPRMKASVAKGDGWDDDYDHDDLSKGKLRKEWEDFDTRRFKA